MTTTQFSADQEYDLDDLDDLEADDDTPNYMQPVNAYYRCRDAR